MRPTNVQQRCWGVVKCVHPCSLPNAVGQDSTFMLFSWYYLIGLHTYTHQFSPIVNVVLCHSSASNTVCHLFFLGIFPKAVYSGHLVALTPYMRCLGLHFSIFSSQWCLLNDKNLGMLNMLLIISIHSIVLVKLWHSTELLPWSFLWVSGSEPLKFFCLWLLMAIICLYDLIIRQCGIT